MQWLNRLYRIFSVIPMRGPIMVYVSHAHVSVPVDFLLKVEEMKRSLSLTSVNGRKITVLNSRANMPVCHVVFAICDFDGASVGYEIGMAVGRFGKPVFAVAQVGSGKAELIEAVCQRGYPQFRFDRYKYLENLVDPFKKYLEWIAGNNIFNRLRYLCRSIADWFADRLRSSFELGMDE